VPVDFFEREVQKTQQLFNQTYEVLVVCDLKLRQATVMSIINLNLICRKITNAKNKDEVRSYIQKFMKSKTTINNHLKQIERRQHANSSSSPGKRIPDDGRSVCG